MSDDILLPRLAPSLIQRTRIESWLARHNNHPLRLLAAPAGSGKTTATVSYIRKHERAVYLHLRRAETPQSFRVRLVRALGLPTGSKSCSELLDALRRHGPVEIALDDVGMVAEETLDEVSRIIVEAPSGVGLIAVVRSRTMIDAARMLADGSAVLCDAEMLAFDAYDAEELAELLDVPYTSSDIAHLLQESDGWAIVTCGAIRHVAETGQHLAGAFEAWSKRHGRFFAEFIRHEMESASERERAAFRQLLAGSREDLPELEATGLFVRYTGDSYRPYRAVAKLCAADPQLVDADVPPPQLLTVRMLGRFEAEIDGKPISWLRRRDQDVFKYLLLKPGGCAPRSELIETFWPDADPHLAAQSLRTACANIRKAIGNLVGQAAAERYISTRGAICLNNSNIVVDVRRFRAHVADGDAEYERGRREEAIAHYRAAEALYRGSLLEEEAEAPWFTPRVALYQELYIHALARQAECWLENGEPSLARQCGYRILKLQPDSAEGHLLVTRSTSPESPTPEPKKNSESQYRPYKAEIILDSRT